MDNPIDEVVMKDARMVTNTLSRYRSDAVTKVQYFKYLQPTEKWDHLIGPYKAMFCASESILPTEGSLSLNQLIDLCFSVHGRSFLTPQGFLDIELKFQNTQNIHMQFENEFSRLWNEMKSVYNAADGSFAFDIKKPSQAEPFLERVLKVVTLGKVAMYVPRRNGDCTSGVYNFICNDASVSAIRRLNSENSQELHPTQQKSIDAQELLAIVNQRIEANRMAIRNATVDENNVGSSDASASSVQYDEEYDKVQLIMNELCCDPAEQGIKARMAIMQSFCTSSFEEQCRLMRRCYELIPGYKTVIDKPNFEITKAHIRNRKCRDYIKKFLKPAIICFKDHCGYDCNVFKQKCSSEPAKLKQLAKESLDNGLTLLWSKWARKCPCQFENKQ